MHSSVTEDSIAKANGQFWEQMLSMSLTAIASGGWVESPRRCIGTGHVMGSCLLRGTWTGRIEVRLSRGLALAATSAMLMQPIEEVQDADTLDATKEIANMIAGTLKSALPRPCSLSVPNAAIEEEDFCALARTEDSVTVFFAHESGELMVRVWEDLPVEEAAEKTQDETSGPNSPLLAEVRLDALVSAF